MKCVAHVFLGADGGANQHGLARERRGFSPRIRADGGSAQHAVNASTFSKIKGLEFVVRSGRDGPRGRVGGGRRGAPPQTLVADRGLSFERLPQDFHARQDDPQLALDVEDQRDAEHRVPAEIEEMIVQADPIQAQELHPKRRQPSEFFRSPCSPAHEFSRSESRGLQPPIFRFGLRQGAPVDLHVVVQRETFELDVPRGDHVIGETFRHMPPYGRDRGFIPARQAAPPRSRTI